MVTFPFTSLCMEFSSILFHAYCLTCSPSSGPKRCMTSAVLAERPGSTAHRAAVSNASVSPLTPAMNRAGASVCTSASNSICRARRASSAVLMPPGDKCVRSSGASTFRSLAAMFCARRRRPSDRPGGMKVSKMRLFFCSTSASSCASIVACPVRALGRVTLFSISST